MQVVITKLTSKSKSAQNSKQEKLVPPEQISASLWALEAIVPTLFMLWLN